MPGLSIHAVDVAAGRPAFGLAVGVFALEPERRLIAEGACGPAGAFDHAIVRQRLAAGLYEVEFAVGAFLGTDAFLDVVPFRFRITDPEAHYHLPFKFTSWGFSLFRGS